MVKRSTLELVTAVQVRTKTSQPPKQTKSTIDDAFFIDGSSGVGFISPAR
jgi:hypothetical protein